MAELNFSPGDINISVDPGGPIDFVADGVFCKINYDGPHVALKAGSKGEVSVLSSVVRTGKIEVTVQRTSPANAIFQSFVAVPPARAPAFAINISDANSNLLAQESGARVEKTADWQAGNDIDNFTWVILCPHLKLFHAGANS